MIIEHSEFIYAALAEGILLNDIHVLVSDETTQISKEEHLAIWEAIRNGNILPSLFVVKLDTPHPVTTMLAENRPFATQVVSGHQKFIKSFLYEIISPADRAKLHLEIKDLGVNDMICLDASTNNLVWVDVIDRNPLEHTYPPLRTQLDPNLCKLFVQDWEKHHKQEMRSEILRNMLGSKFSENKITTHNITVSLQDGLTPYQQCELRNYVTNLIALDMHFKHVYLALNWVEQRSPK